MFLVCVGVTLKCVFCFVFLGFVVVVCMGWERRRKRRLPFDDFFGGWFEEFEEMVERFFREPFAEFDRLMRELPRVRLPDGTEVTGPIVWGWSVRIGPDGKPEVRQFGNFQPSSEPSSMIKEVREPLVDVIEGEGEVIVAVEVPGVDESEISVNCTRDELEVRAGDRYYKRIKLPACVKPDELKISYRNGILEVKIPKEVVGGKG